MAILNPRRAAPGNERSITMKSKQRGGLVIGVAAILGAIIGVVFIIATMVRAVDSDACEAKWKDSGLKAEYRARAGCMVQKLDGRWLPASAIREASN